MQTHLTLKSNNLKTGRIPVSTSDEDTCPPSCGLKGKGCYADNYHLRNHWNKVNSGERGDDWPTFCAKIAALPDEQVWRHNQAGDLPGKGNRISAKQLRQLTAANEGKRGFTYTHKPMTKANQRLVKEANEGGFTINLSTDSIHHVDAALALGVGPVVTLLTEDAEPKQRTINGTLVIACPAQMREDVTCSSCQLCQRVDRKVAVGFYSHGTGKNKAEQVINFYRG